jgi:hypothetical protein
MMTLRLFAFSMRFVTPKGERISCGPNHDSPTAARATPQSIEKACRQNGLVEMFAALLA